MVTPTLIYLLGKFFDEKGECYDKASLFWIRVYVLTKRKEKKEGCLLEIIYVTIVSVFAKRTANRYLNLEVSIPMLGKHCFSASTIEPL
jgi:hypothetical protein